MSRRKRTSSPIDRFGGKNPSRLDPDDETVIVAVRLPRRIAAKIARKAEKEGQTRSEYLREILTAGFR